MQDDDRYTIRQRDGTMLGPVSFETVEYLVKAGKLEPYETIAAVGSAFHQVVTYPELARLLSSRLTEGKEVSPFELPTEEVQGEPDLLDGVEPARETANYGRSEGEVPPAFVGDLSNVPVARLIYFFSATRQTGRLELRQGGQQREIFFGDSGPRYSRSREDNEILGQLLTKRSLVSASQLAAANIRAEGEGVNLGDALVASGALPPFQLFEVLQEVFADRLLNTFRWMKGRFAFYRFEQPEDEPPPINLEVIGLIKEGIRRSFNLKTLQNILGSYYGSEPVKVTNKLVNLERLKFSPREARVYKSIGRTSTLNELIRELSSSKIVSELEAHQIIYFLSQLELVVFGDKYLGRRVQDEVRLLEQ